MTTCVFTLKAANRSRFARKCVMLLRTARDWSRLCRAQPRCPIGATPARLALLLGFCLTPAITKAAVTGVQHVVVIGLDGMGGRGVARADTPNMHALMHSGAWTLKARSVMPSSSSPNWASMIMGAGPDRHGVTSNDWQPYRHEVDPVAVGSGGIFPTIFGVMRDQRPDAVMGVFHDWDGFGRLLETNAPNVLRHVKDALETSVAAIDYLKKARPNFLFLHFDGIDHAGHGFGWTSVQYDKEVAMVDSLIGAILQAIDDAGMTDSTIVLVTADHGGVGTRHGGDTPQEREIPWIIRGPGVVSGHHLQQTVNTFDTAATIAYIFGLTPPDCWVGKPVLEAFNAARTARGNFKTTTP